MGQAIVEAEGQRRTAACIGGLLSVVDGAVTLVPTTFEWSDQIDADRAEKSRQRAEGILSNKDSTDAEIQLAEARLKRSLIRTSVATRRF